MHIDALSVSMSVYHKYAWCPWWPEEGTGVPGTGITNCWGGCAEVVKVGIIS